MKIQGGRYVSDVREIADNFFSKTCELLSFTNEEEWLKMRMNGIGGSDVSSIMGHNKWRTRKDIYHSKKILQPQTTSEAIEFGKAFEPLIFEAFKYKYKDVFETLDYKDIMFRNIFIPYMQASLDGVLVEKATNKVGVLEIKTTQARKSKWYYEDGTYGIPQEYIDQAIHYFNVTNADFVVFQPLINYDRIDNDRTMEFLQPRRIERADVLDYCNEVCKECINFWEEYVKKDIEPKNLITF
jgi:putative phage-type endonuclease